MSRSETDRNVLPIASINPMTVRTFALLDGNPVLRVFNFGESQVTFVGVHAFMNRHPRVGIFRSTGRPLVVVP